VYYYFECTNHGDANSDWQLSETYVATGLTPNTQYTFQVKARDSYLTPNETGWSSTKSATTLPPPTNVEIIGPWEVETTEDLYRDPCDGTNRLLVFIAHEESTSGDPTLTSVTYGGREMTKVIERSAVSGYGNYVAAFILNDANITAATSGNFSVTWSASTSSVSYASVFLANVNQSEPNGAEASNGTTSSTPNPITTSALATNNEDMVIDAATCGNNGTYTLQNGFTQGTHQSVGSYGHTGVTGYKVATGASETPSASHSSVNRQVIIGFVVQAGAAAYQTCDDVKAGGYRFVSDLSGDCYVNYIDLKIITSHWLDDCTEPDNCEGADFAPTDGIVDLYDFSDFAEQWLLCNNPEDSNCVPNW
jgi:hypothetical protein